MMNTTLSVPSYVAVLSLQFGATQWALSTNVDGVTPEMSIVRPDPGVNSINWLVGHVLTVRNILLPIIGRDPIVDEVRTAPYQHGAKTDDPGALIPLPELLDLLGSSHESLLAGIAAIDEERLVSKSPFSPGNDPNETVGSVLTKSAFHESYHAGQTGIVRRLLGLPGAIG